MRLNKLVAAVAALSLLVTPVAASAAQSLSLAGAPAIERAAAGTEDSSELGGRRGLGWLLIPVALGILVFVIVELGDDNDLPDSP